MRILVADDSPMGLELMRDLLELAGHTVDTAHDGVPRWSAPTAHNATSS